MNDLLEYVYQRNLKRQADGSISNEDIDQEIALRLREYATSLDNIDHRLMDLTRTGD